MSDIPGFADYLDYTRARELGRFDAAPDPATDRAVKRIRRLDPQGDPTMTDPAAPLACVLCGTNPARGFAAHDGRRYCHAGESPTCYERAVTNPAMTRVEAYATGNRGAIDEFNRLDAELEAYVLSPVPRRRHAPEPYVTRGPDDMLTLFWPDGIDSTLVAREILEAQVAEHNELAALKARRCDGCRWWDAQRDDTGICGAPLFDHGGPLTPADHACNAWEAQ